VAAIDPATGETKWVFDPKVYDNGLGIPAIRDGCIAASPIGAAVTTSA
jgi:hypothetical protein